MAGAYGYKKIITVFIACVFTVNFNYDHLAKKKKKVFRDFTFLHNGDLVCRLGTGYFSNYFREYASNEKLYSHIGLIVLENKVLYVYHSEASELTGAGGVKREKLEDFLDGITVYSFFRLSFSREEKEKVISQANKYLRQHIKFDLNFISDNDNELYCTEFVAKCINKGIDREIIKPTLRLNSKFLFSLDDIYENNYVKSINKY